MISPRRIGRFFGPWLAFSALSGVSGALCVGVFATLIGFIAGLFTLLGGAVEGTFLPAAVRVGRDFPQFALIICWVVAAGFAGGFFIGLLSSLVGGNAGLIWSIGSTLVLLLAIVPFYAYGPHGRTDPTLFLLPFTGLVGVVLPKSYLNSRTTLREWEKSPVQWLRASWLTDPPFAARFAGIMLPVALYIGWEVALVAPTFFQNESYVPRLGRWVTWQNSRRITKYRPIHGRASCQSNLKQIMLGVLQYQQDYDEKYPPKPTAPQGGAAAVIYPYVRSTPLFQCPQEFYRYDGGDFQSGDYSDYWFNARFYGLNFAKLTSPSQSVNWGDGNTGAGEANAAYSLRALPPVFAPATRHFGTANYAFADGHVKALRRGAISTLPPGVAGTSFSP